MRILAADQSGMRRSRGVEGADIKYRKYAPDPPSLPPPPLKKIFWVRAWANQVAFGLWFEQTWETNLKSVQHRGSD